MLSNGHIGIFGIKDQRQGFLRCLLHPSKEIRQGRTAHKLLVFLLQGGTAGINSQTEQYLPMLLEVAETVMLTTDDSDRSAAFILGNHFDV